MYQFSMTLSLLCLSIALASCAGKYTPPTGGSTASLKIENASVFQLLKVEEFDHPSTCAGVLNMHEGSGIASYATHSVRVKAGTRFYLRLVGLSSAKATSLSDPRHKCTIAVSFVPDAGRSYFARFESQGHKCYLQFVEQLSAAHRADKFLPVAGLQRAPNCE
jgi:hypothetical protein